jgi:predicted enzyme related to lactoylglutathione lyase
VSDRPDGPEEGGVAIVGVLAQSTVSDLAVSEDWYSALFGRPPGARPMAGLLEWRVATAGLRVWSEPDRAGRSTVVLDTDDLDSVAARLQRIGLTDAPPQQATSSRILAIEDPDGNRVVLTGT